MYGEANSYFDASKRKYTSLNNKSGIARNLTNQGILADAKGDYGHSLRYHLSALKINEQLTDSNSIQISQANIAIAYLHLKKTKDALFYHLKALRISERMGKKISIAINTGNVGETYFEMAKNYSVTSDSFNYAINQSINHLNSAILLCRQIVLLAPATEFTSYLAEAYYVKGDYMKAYEAGKNYIALRDTVFSEERLAEFAELDRNRQLELVKKDNLLKDRILHIKQLELKQKRSEKIFYISCLVVSMLLLIVTTIFIRNYRKLNRVLAIQNRKNRNVILDQLKDLGVQNSLLREIADLHSHDIRGHVATILGLSELFDVENTSAANNKVILDGVVSSSKELDIVIKEIVKKENELKLKATSK